MPAMVLPERDLWTVDDVWALPRDGTRYEVLHGELLVTPLPDFGHQLIAADLARRLGNWAYGRRGVAVLSPGGVYVTATTWLEPDVVVYPVDRSDRAGDWRELPPPVLVVEVLSPSTRKRDRHRKRPAYLAHGVGEVWIVDHERRLVERWTAASEFPVVVTDRIAWSPSAGVEPVVFELTELFGAPVE